jgi:type IV pilus assembly protein PilC
MIRANLSLSESLHLIIQQSDNPNVKKVAVYLKNAIEKGIPFHTALAHYQHIFQPLLIQMVQVGENIGNIGMILNAYVIHQKKIHSLKRKFSLSMMYPAMVFIVTFLVVSFLLLFITPTFQDVFAEFSETLPAGTKLLIHIGEHYFLYLAMVLVSIFALYLFIKTIAKSTKIKFLRDKYLLQIPIWGNMMNTVFIIFFCRTLGLLMEHGNPLSFSLPIAMKSIDNQFIQTKFKKVKSEIAKGKELSVLLKKYDIFPDMIIQMLSVGESTATLDKTLLQIADEYEHLFDDKMKVITAIIEPVLIVLLGVLIALVLIALYSPLFDMIGNFSM